MVASARVLAAADRLERHGPFTNLADTIGNTPLVEISQLSPNPQVRLFAKLEGANPTGSVKDRIGRAMIDRAEQSGQLTSDRILLEELK